MTKLELLSSCCNVSKLHLNLYRKVLWKNFSDGPLRQSRKRMTATLRENNWNEIVSLEIRRKRPLLCKSRVLSSSDPGSSKPLASGHLETSWRHFEMTSKRSRSSNLCKGNSQLTTYKNKAAPKVVQHCVK